MKNNAEFMQTTNLKAFGAEKCKIIVYHFQCSRKCHFNTCPRHGEKASLVNLDGCPGCFIYVKPCDNTDMLRWLGFVHGPHNHDCPSISKPTSLLESKVKEVLRRDPSLQTGDLQRGYGLECMSVAISLVAANATTMSNLRKKAFKMGGFEQTTSSSMIAHFDNYIQKEVDNADEVYLNPEDKLRVLQATTPYQRDIITVEKFECGIFMTLLMMRVLAEGEYFECDVTFPGLSCYKYLLNITTFNSSSLRHDVVCRVLMTGDSTKCYELSFRNVFKLVTEQHPAFQEGAAIKGITVDFSLAQTNGMDAILENGPDIIKGCRSVHFIWQVDKVCKSDEEKQ